MLLGPGGGATRSTRGWPAPCATHSARTPPRWCSAAPIRGVLRGRRPGRPRRRPGRGVRPGVRVLRDHDHQAGPGDRGRGRRGGRRRGPARGGGRPADRRASGQAALDRAARLGLAVGAWVLPDLVGRGRAMELTLTGRWVEAAEALALGLVNRVEDDPAARGGLRRRPGRRSAGTGQGQESWRRPACSAGCTPNGRRTGQPGRRRSRSPAAPYPPLMIAAAPRARRAP